MRSLIWGSRSRKKKIKRGKYFEKNCVFDKWLTMNVHENGRRIVQLMDRKRYKLREVK